MLILKCVYVHTRTHVHLCPYMFICGSRVVPSKDRQRSRRVYRLSSANKPHTKNVVREWCHSHSHSTSSLPPFPPTSLPRSLSFSRVVFLEFFLCYLARTTLEVKGSDRNQPAIRDTHTHTHIHTHTRTYTRTRMQERTHAHTCTHAHTHTLCIHRTRERTREMV